MSCSGMQHKNQWPEDEESFKNTYLTPETIVDILKMMVNLIVNVIHAKAV